MDAEIVAIGSELLLGTTIDTNSAYLARQLAGCGVNLYRKSVVGDNTARIAACISEALARVDLVICTGGLGPTVDDVTREAAALACGRELVFHPALLEQIQARFASFRRTMSESNRRQAYVPHGARVIENARGTAPAFMIDDPRGTVIVLPGVPSEMRYLFEHAVLPYLRDERGLRTVILVRTLHAAGLSESEIGERIADLMTQTNPTVGISAKRARYELRIGAKADSPAAAEALLDEAAAILQARLGTALIGTETLDTQISRVLAERGLTLALHEGLLSAPVHAALVQGSPDLTLLRGVVLAPPAAPLSEEAVPEAARQAALDARAHYQTDLALGVHVASQPGSDGATTVSAALATPGEMQLVTRRYDLREPDNLGFVGTLGLHMLQRFLLGSDR